MYIIIKKKKCDWALGLLSFLCITHMSARIVRSCKWLPGAYHQLSGCIHRNDIIIGVGWWSDNASSLLSYTFSPTWLGLCSSCHRGMSCKFWSCSQVLGETITLNVGVNSRVWCLRIGNCIIPLHTLWRNNIPVPFLQSHAINSDSRIHDIHVAKRTTGGLCFQISLS